MSRLTNKREYKKFVFYQKFNAFHLRYQCIGTWVKSLKKDRQNTLNIVFLTCKYLITETKLRYQDLKDIMKQLRYTLINKNEFNEGFQF